MYLNSVEIFNFGPVKHRKLDFIDGLIVVRGANENGKSSTIIQAPLYAFFGSSTLDCSIDHVVHTGEPVSSLKVIVQYGPYTVTRTKAAASVIGPDIKISGQAEVSDFFYKLFGIHKGTEGMVLVSEQGDTAGIVKRKNGEITSFIESIAGFDQIDRVLDMIKVKYPTGSKKALEGQLETAGEELEGYKAEELPDVTALVVEKDVITSAITAQEKLIADKRGEIKTLEAALKKIELSNQHITSLAREVQSKRNSITAAESALTAAQLEQQAVPVFDEKELTAAEGLIEKFPDKVKAWQARQWIATLGDHEHYWDESEEALEERISVLTDVVHGGRTRIANREGVIKALKKGIQVDTICSKCGSDVKDRVETINKKIDLEIQEIYKEIEEARSFLLADEEEWNILNAVMSAHLTLERAAASHFGYISVDRKNIPHTYFQVGITPEEPDQRELAKARQLLISYQQSLVKIAACQATIKEKTSTLAQLKTELEEKQQEIAQAGQEVDVTDKRKEIFDEEISLKKLVDTGAGLGLQLTNKEKEIASAKEKIQGNKNNLDRVAKAISAIHTALRVEDRNGKILKSVRDAKPKVLNMVWDKVISYVTQNFSEMRGLNSVVEKTEKGFNVDNRPTSRLSGSAKSILGIAMRAAVRDIFAPSCGFILFDEPFGDMDTERTGAALAAIQTVRGQRFIITHESESEMAADQVIEI